MFMLIVGAVLALGLASPLAARAVEPSFDCAKAESSAEKVVCSSNDLALLDRELARLSRLALTKGDLPKEAESTLKATQRGWIKGRDDCWKANDGLPSCVRDSYVLRIGELRSAFAAARSEDDDGRSRGPFAFQCEGLEVPVSAVFAEGEHAYAVLRWAENAVVLQSVVAASGAKYAGQNFAGPFAFWIKGDVATFSWPDNARTSCHAE
jgi:uncharacterized protein